MDRLSTLLQFHTEDPDDPFTRFALASEYLKRGDRERALRFFEGLVADHPGYLGTYYHLGKLYQHLGRTDEAVHTFRQGLRVAQQHHDFHARSELQSALLEAQGVGFEDEED